MALTQAQIKQILVDGFATINPTEGNIDPDRGYTVVADAIFGATNGLDADVPETFVESFNGRTGAVVPQSGDYTTTLVTEGSNLYYTQARFDSAFSLKNTDALSEGLSNLYYTEGRFDTSFSGKDTDDLTEGLSNKYYSTLLFNTDFSSKTTTDLTEGSNLYYTQARFDSAFSGKTTDNLSEGSTNLYWKEAPNNGLAYLRKNLSWIQANAGDTTLDLSSGSAYTQGLGFTNVNDAIVFILDELENVFKVNP